MEIKQLTEAMHNFVRSQGWYDDSSTRQQTLRNLTISLNLEASEALEFFQWDEKLDDKEAFSDELADVALYLIQIASLAGIDLEKAILAKLEKNYQRDWSNNEP